MNLLLLHLFAREARVRLAGGRVGTPAWVPPLLSVPVDAPAGHTHLVAVLEAPGPFCFLAPAAPLEGLGPRVRLSALAGAHIEEVSQYEGDRVLRIDARPGRDERGEEMLSLLLHLYGSTGGAVLRRGESVLESLGRRPRTGKKRSGDEPRSIVDVSADVLSFFATAGDLTGENSPQSVVAGLDRPLVAAFTASRGILDSEALAAFRDAVVAEASPFRLAFEQRAGNAVPVPPAAGDSAQLGPFDNALAACAGTGAVIVESVERRVLSEMARPLERRLARNRKLARNLESDIEKAVHHEQVRREAEVLAAFQTKIPGGQAVVELDDIYEPGQRLRIELDPAESISAQIERRFRKATKLEKSLVHASRRLELVREENAGIEAILEQIGADAPVAEISAALASARDRFGLESATPGKRAAAPAGPGYRRFDLGPDWFVILGRNNKENDDVTFHHASPGDLWFHAQSVPGSHVVLKSRTGSADNPPARIIEQAASVAAHFSKARHSGLVPVIYTLRKYVRKFRGAKPGQVRCEREKTVMVAPALPQGE